MSLCLYFAPGSGLGHLNRALAVCLALRERGVDAEIVTNSPFAEGMARAARHSITRIAIAQWKQAAPEYARSRAPQLAIVDTFPFGLRGEWSMPPSGLRIAYMARRLRMENYRESGDWTRFAAIIALEALFSDHEEAIASATVSVVRLPGPIRLPPGVIQTPVPPALGKLLDSGKGWLVVHSGPPAESRHLVHVARSKMPPDSPLALIAPWGVDGVDCPCFEYFPACNLTAGAAHVVSGAGYNAVADMLVQRERHTAIPFERKFDNQAARLIALPDRPVDGTAFAADAIAHLLATRQPSRPRDILSAQSVQPPPSQG